MIMCLVIALFALVMREVRKLKLKLTIRIPTAGIADTPQSGLNRDGLI